MLVRHPETEANVCGQYVGRGDAPYTELGLVQVEALVERIAGLDPTAIWSSPLRRAFTVAQLASDELGVPLHIDHRLNELDFGVAEGFTFEETVEQRIAFDFQSVDGPVAPGGESRRDIWDRSVSAMDEILAMDGRVAVVTHGGVFRSALPYLLGLSIDHIWTFHIRNAQIAVVRVVEGHGMLEEFVLG
jgi:broad specificity phosphatase PhoE